MRLSWLSLLISCVYVSSILVEMTPESKTRCYTTEVSPDKTLQAKFGLLRNDNEECQVRFTINIKDEQNKIRESIHDNQYYCRQTRNNEPYVVKHTSSWLEYHGIYQLCVEPISIRSRLLLIQVYIGQKMNPMGYYQEDSMLPLVEAAQLIEVDEKARTIKRVLLGLQAEAARSKQQGDNFDAKVKDIMDANRTITIVHVVLLIIFGVLWVYLVRQLKREQ